MNYLGHTYLSFDDNQIITGNFIADYVKGKKYLEYPEGIQQGILLHRMIDSYTDKNENFLQIKNYLNPFYGLYAGVVADIVVDHFLAANWEDFHPIRLEDFSITVYKILEENYHYLPDRIKNFFSNFVGRNRLLSYSTVSGLEEALMIMSFRTSLPEKTKPTINHLKENYTGFENLAMKLLKETSIFVNEAAQTGWHPTSKR